MRRIQSFNRGQRLLLFALIFGGGILLLLAITVFLVLESLNSGPREVARTQLEGVTVTEFVTLLGDDAYPATITTAPDGAVYTGSYDTGAVWAISADGETITELDNTRERIGAVTGLAFSPDGTLYILDRLESDPSVSGGMIWRVLADGTLEEVGDLDDERGFVAPHDLVFDASGRLYVSDRGRREVWRFEPDGSSSLWWRVPESDPLSQNAIVTGLGYDPVRDAILITDSEAGTIYRVGVEDGSSEIVYRFQGTNDPPGFDGVTTSPDGRVFAAAFGARDVVEIRDGEMIVLATGFRGGSDVAYADGRLIVTNFDQRSLVLPGIEPQLPFALDVVTLPEE